MDKSEYWKRRYEEANGISIKEYLSFHGYAPKREGGGKAFYQSPIRDGDSDPSFVVFVTTNTWWDFGLGKGRTLIDLGIILDKCRDSKEFVENYAPRFLNGPVFSNGIIDELPKAQPVKGKEEESKVKILSVNPLNSPVLLSYVSSRKISLDIARRFCVEIEFEVNKRHLAVGFKNDSGGYELRNQYMKISSLPKDSTFINNGSKNLHITEGFFSHLSEASRIAFQKQPVPNYLVLNGIGLFDKKLPLMLSHDAIHLLLDNGKGGRKLTAKALSIDNKRFQDDSWFYFNYDDPNDWWRAEGHKIYQVGQKKEEMNNQARGMRP